MTEWVQLLGGARAKVGTEWVDFVPDMRYQLLAYLAHQQDWVSRERIAFLFWADTDTGRAKQNLRQLLRRVRSLAWLDGFEVDDHRVRWTVPTDLVALRRGIEQGSIEEALRRYPGPLLPGLEGVEDNEFTTWLVLERERLHAYRREVSLEHAQTLRSNGQHDRAEAILDLHLNDAGLDEEALVSFMHTALEAGHRRKALRRYEAFRKRLAMEMELEPSAETQELAREIEAGGRAASGRPATLPLVTSTLERDREHAAPARYTLPKAATSFVGRKVELAEIAARLADPDCRLLTLVGPGGVGKTRMAMSAAEDLSGVFGSGALLLLLEALPSSDMIPLRIAERLGLTLSDNEDHATQLARFLAEKDLLLILDNLEHLLDGVSLLSALLEACPNLKVLTTSRERLNLAEEWLLPVRGLAYPEDDAAPREEATSSDAVQLFTQRAKRMRPSFSLTGNNVPHILRICRSVEGFPLALELAATWVRLLPLEQIAKEIDTNVDTLATRARNVPKRHQSVRAVFDHSWRLLTPHEQAGLRNLSVFQGGFTREAAIVIAGASLPVLASLVDKSMLRVTSPGRFDYHPLLHQYAQEHLAKHPAEERGIRRRHTSYFLQFLFERKVTLWQTEQKATLEAIEADFENVRAAWLHAVQQRQVGRLRQAAEPLNKYLTDRSNVLQALHLLQEALDVLDDEHPDHRDLVILLLALLAWKHVLMGRSERGHELASSAWSLVGPQRSTEEALYALGALGSTALLRGDHLESQRHRQEFLAIARKTRVDRYLWVALTNLANTEVFMGHYERAEGLLHEALELGRNAEAHSAVSGILTSLGETKRLQGRPEQALSILHEAVQRADLIDARKERMYALHELGAVHCDLAEFGRAEELCREALRQSRDLHSTTVEVLALTTLGRIAIGQGEVALAEQHLMQGIDLAWTVRQPPRILDLLASLAKVNAQQDQNEQATILASLVRRHESTEKHVANRAEALLESLRGTSEAGAFARAVEHGARSSLAEVVEDALQQKPIQ